jgi:hypothetical protein
MPRLLSLARRYRAYVEDTANAALDANVGLYLFLTALNLILVVTCLAFTLFFALKGSSLGFLPLVPTLALALTAPLPAARLTVLLHSPRQAHQQPL